MIDRVWWSDPWQKTILRARVWIHRRLTIINKHQYIRIMHRMMHRRRRGLRENGSRGRVWKERLHRDAFELIIWCRPVWIIQVSADGMNLDGRYLYEKQKPENGIAFWFITSIAERNVYFFNFSARNSCSSLMIFLSVCHAYVWNY